MTGDTTRADRTDRADRVAQQRALYGESVGEMVRRACTALDLSQHQLAQVLGLSPAMLSQLASGHRIKMGNPLTLARLQAVLSLVPEAPGLTARELGERLQTITRSHDTLLSVRTQAREPDGAATVRRTLRAVASARQLEQAARAVQDLAPELAELLRVYGTGSAQEAAQHYGSIRHLVEPPDGAAGGAASEPPAGSTGAGVAAQ